MFQKFRFFYSIIGIFLIICDFFCEAEVSFRSLAAGEHGLAFI